LTLTPIEGNWMRPSVFDTTSGLIYNAITPSIPDNLHFDIVGPTGTPIFGGYATLIPPAVNVINVPTTDFNGIESSWSQIGADMDLHSVLSDEVTDAEALAVATVVTSNGTVAENFPNYQATLGDGPNTHYSRFTQVAFTLHFTRLIVGRTYVALVSLISSNGVRQDVSYPFVAPGVSHQITDFIPQPSAGLWTKVFQPLIRFA
jgi:hypothetical protein